MTSSEGLRREILHANGLEFSALRQGPVGADLVLCLHGFPDTPTTFRHQQAALAAAGFDVVVPHLRGYEPTSQPSDGDYDLMTLVSDVVSWLDDLGVARAHVVGHDWGAVLTYVLAAHHPERIRTATALAIPPLARIPAGVRRVPRQLLRSWYMTWFQLPWVAERSVQFGDGWLLRRLWTLWSPRYDLTEGEWSELRSTFAGTGVTSSSLGYYRQNATPPIMLGLRTSEAMTATKTEVAMLIVNGAQDGCMDRRMFERCVVEEDFAAGVEHVELSDAGHFLHLEDPAQINRLLLRHFERNSS